MPFLAVVGIGAATEIFGNGLSNVSHGQGFFDGAGKAALWGGIGAAASFGIGAAGILEALRDNYRVTVGLRNSTPRRGHASLIKKIKYWPDAKGGAKAKIWLNQVSSERRSPFIIIFGKSVYGWDNIQYSKIKPNNP